MGYLDVEVTDAKENSHGVSATSFTPWLAAKIFPWRGLEL
jgi:hypothetical protein